MKYNFFLNDLESIQRKLSSDHCLNVSRAVFTILMFHHSLRTLVQCKMSIFETLVNMQFFFS